MCGAIALMMEAASTSEMSINFYQTTWHNNPEDSHLHSHCCEDLNLTIHCEFETFLTLPMNNNRQEFGR
jgi:hypothetical protein